MIAPLPSLEVTVYDKRYRVTLRPHGVTVEAWNRGSHQSKAHWVTIDASNYTGIRARREAKRAALAFYDAELTKHMLWHPRH